MKRSLFLLGAVAVAVLALTPLRLAAARRVPRLGSGQAGRCANRRRKLRWSSYTAADFS